MLPSPASLYIDTVGVAEGGEVGCGQVDTSFYHDRNDKGKNKIVEQGSCSNVDKEPPDKIQLPNQQVNFSNKNKNPSNTGKTPIDHQDNFDEYREPDSEDEYDVDTHSLGDGIEPGEEITNSDQIQKGLLLSTSNVDEILEFTGKQGLSPRGRKLSKSIKNPSTSKPNTRARSRGN